MTEGVYLLEAYRTELDSVVRSSSDGLAVLDRTIFYPAGGGQPSDTGSLVGPDGTAWPVEAVEKSDAGILHRLGGSAPTPAAGTAVRGRLDWDRRYSNMRYHTALHILSGVVYRRWRTGITGGQIYDGRARMDFSLPEFGRPLADELIGEMNRVVKEARPVAVRFLPRAQAERDPTLVRVAATLMPDVTEVRLIDIEGFDVQADGGTHVRNTREVGEVRLDRIENKGARNKRLYISLGPPRPEPTP